MVRALAIWGLLAAIVLLPLGFAATSPLLPWRQPVYIVAGFAGIFGLCLILFQPLLVRGALPGLSPITQRRLHRFGGIALITAIVLHVTGLWITSPPDVIDALLFTSPTPFSVWGVIAMWAAFGTAALAVFRRKMRLNQWRVIHKGLALVIVAGTIMHVLLIEGTMENLSKWALCALIATMTLWATLPRRR